VKNHNIFKEKTDVLLLRGWDYMADVVKEYGRNAGKIWKTLDTHDMLTQTKLMSDTKLSEDQFFAAVGWLARENKIYRDGAVYRLGETNFVVEI
jgi:hypothetical protein